MPPKLLSRLLAFALFLLAWVAYETQARASEPIANDQIECKLAASLLDLSEAEEEHYAELCEGRSISAKQRKNLYQALERLLRLGNWRTVLAMSQLAKHNSGPPPDISQLAVQLQTLLDRKRDDTRCRALHDSIEDFYNKRRDDEFAVVTLEGLDTDICKKEKITRLADADAYVVIAYLGAAGDEVQALYLDDGHSMLVRTALELKSASRPEVKLLLVPRDQRVMLSVAQPEFDIAWTKIYVPLDDSYAVGKRPELVGANPSACLGINVAFDASSQADAQPILLIDGRVQSWDQLEASSNPKELGSTASRTLDVTAGLHEIVIVPRIPGEAPSSPVVQQRVIERQVELTVKPRCESLNFDVTGLDTNNRYGIAGITVDGHCEALGITRAGVRDHVSAELRRHGKDVRSLDVLADSVRDFFALQAQLDVSGSKPVGGDRGTQSDEQRLGQIAQEIARQGVDQLLTFELRCSKVDNTVTLTGTKIDLFEFSKRAKDSAAGADLTDVVSSRSASMPHATLRHAFDRILGDFLDAGFIQVTPANATKLRDAHTGVSVSLEAGSDTANMFVVKVFPSGVSTKSRTQTNLCASVGPFNALNPGADAPKRRTPMLQREYERPLRKKKMDESIELGGVPAGTWLIEVSMRSGKTVLSSVACIQVRESPYEWWIQLDAGRRIRGRYLDARFAPRQDQINHMHALTGVRLDLSRFGRYGGEIGYGLTQYAADTPASWDGLSELDLNAVYTWTRHSLLFGGVIGAELPMSTCEYRRRPKRDTRHGFCRTFASRVDVFVDLHVTFDFGVIALGRLPESVRQQSLLFDPDFDVGTQSGLRFAVSPYSRIGIFAGAWFTDVETAAWVRFASRRPAGERIAADLLAGYDFDYSVRWVIGAELAIARKVR